MSLDVDLILDDLESRWNQSAEVDITEFLIGYGIDPRLQQLSSEQQRLLIEVVHVDLERRWNAGSAPLPTAVEYLTRYPSLNTDSYRNQLLEFEARLQSRTKPSGFEVKSETLFEPSPELSVAPIGHDFAEGEAFGPYRIIRKIGEGGMGTVYRAVHSHLGKTVALKLLSPRLMHDAEVISRFRREMRAAGQIDHPNVVRAMDAGEINQRHFLVTEFVDGTDLTSLVRQHGTLSVDETCRIISQAASALSAAHQIGMVHRDVKPSNLMLTKSGEVKLLDLGLMRLTSDESGEATNFTTAGNMFGTPDYMAPEQWEDARNADQRTDLYALGCTMFFLLVGRAPYSSDRTRSVYSKMKAHAESEIPDLCKIRQDVDSTVGSAFERLMAKRPGDRFASADELISYLANRQGAGVGQVSFPSSQTGEPARTIVMSGQPIDSESSTQIDVPSNARLGSRNSWFRPQSRVWLTALAAVVLVSGIVWKFSSEPTQIETAGSATAVPDQSRLPSSAKPSTTHAANTAAALQLEFDGFDDRVDIPPFEFDWSQPFTWEAEVQLLPDKPRITTDDPSFADPIYRHGTHETTSFSVLFDRAASHWLVVHRPTPKTHPTFYSVPCQVMGQRLHLAVTYTAQELKLSVNGEAQPLRLVPDLKEVPPGSKVDLETYSSNPISLGEDLYLAKNTHRWFRGRIGYVCISRGIRDLQAFSLETRPESNPEAELQYLFSQDQQLQLLDSSKHERHGRIRGAVWRAKSDKVEVPQPVTPQPTPSLPDPDRVAAEWVISHGGEVGLAGRGEFVKKLPDLPQQSFQVRHAIIQNVPEFTEADGQRLAQLRELTNVEFIDTTLAPGAIKTLAKCRHLEELRVIHGSMTEATLSEVLSVSQLRSLAFVILPGVTNDLVAKLSQLPQLRDLQLYSCPQVTEAGLVQMANARPPKLQWLSLGVTQIGVAGTKAISGIPHLQRLDLQGQQLNDETLTELSHSQALSKLSLNVDGEITTECIAKLQKSLTGCQIWVKKSEHALPLNGDAYRDVVSQLMARGCKILVSNNEGELKWAGDNTPIPPGDVIYAEDFYSKDAIDPSATAMDQADVQLLAQLTDISRVNVAHPPSGGLRELLPLKNLNYLVVGGSPLTEADIALLPSFTKLSSLAAVIPDDAALETIAKLPHLSYLLPYSGSGITDKGLIHLQSVPAMSRIDLVYTTISREAAQAFANARPDVIVNWKDGIRLDPMSPDQAAADWVLGHGGSVTLVEGGKVVQQMGELPPDPYQIRAVEIRNVDHFTEDDGQRLARLRELSSVSFVDTTHSPGSIKALSGCPRLERMGLHGGNSSDATLSEILHIQKLRSILFINAGVKDEFVSRLGQLQQLLAINCYICPGLTEDGLVRLAAAAPPKLQSLYLGMNSFTEKGMKAIASLPHLQTFNLKVTTLDQTAVAGLAGSSSLAEVWLRCEGTFSQADTTAMQNTLQGCQVSTSNSDLAPALYTTPAYRHAIHKLRSRGYGIAISYFDTISDKSQWFDDHNPSLPETVIYAKMLASQNPWETNTKAMDDAEIEQLANLTNLQGISFGKLPSDGLLKFLPLKNLTSLEIIQSPLTEKDVELLPAFSKLSTVSAVLPQDKSLEAISKLPHLSHLIIGHQSEITDDGLKVLESASVLSTLNLQYSKVSPEAAQAFANARPDVIVYTRGVRLDAGAK